jgi:uncharacterized membrane protein YoaK (UPF0700 family)
MPFVTDLLRTFSPSADARHGPLPPLLIGLTVVTGLVDAFSYLLLGHVFVANMTGNVVFLGFALAGAPGFSIAASALALVAFWAGAFAGGTLGSKLGHHRGRLMRTATTIEAVLFAAAVALVLAVVVGHPGSIPTDDHYPLIALLAVALGIQNATSRKLAVPDLTTTVLTLTITGTAADSALAGGAGSASTAGRRLVSVTSMFLGALVGALLVIHVQIAWPLAIGLVLLIGIAIYTARCSRGDPAWVHPS